MANQRIELPDGDYALVRDPKKVPERLRRPVRAAAIELQQSLPEDQRRGSMRVGKPTQEAPDEVQAAFGTPPVDQLAAEVEKKDELPFLPNVEQQELVDAYNEAQLLSIVVEWSFGEVTREVLQDIPGDAFDALLKFVQKSGEDGSDDSLASDPTLP